MIKVSVLYPNTPGARFDHEYYRDKHMPMVKSKMGESCKYYTVDKGIAGGMPGTPPTYVGMCHLFCDSVEAIFRPALARMQRRSWPTSRTTQISHPLSRSAKLLLVDVTQSGPA